MKKPITIVLLILLSATVLNARPTRNFQFWKFGYQWTTDSGKAPGPGSFSPSHVSPLSSGIGLTLTETSSGSIVGRREHWIAFCTALSSGQSMFRYR